MKRPWCIWLAFGLALAVLLAAMGSVSLTALRLDRAEAEARRQAALEENVRLALWRMDSRLAPLIAQENARPYFAYSAFYPAERAYTRMFAEIDRDEVLLPSPLLTQPSEHVRLHFQFGPSGALTSPQVPTGNMRDLAETGYVSGERIDAAASQLAALAGWLSRRTLAAALPVEGGPQPGLDNRVKPEDFSVQALDEQDAWRSVQQELRNLNEYQARARSYEQAASQQKSASGTVRRPDTPEALLRPVWVGEQLVLARRVSVDGVEYLQGCWLDWPNLEAWLVDDIRDLLPGADLEPLATEASDPRARVLASLPVRLLPGELRTAPRPLLTPIRLSLLMAWASMIVAGSAVAVLLVGAVSLSERRAAFVSAVTHELRTPLTTFQLYSEMLAQGVVRDEEKRQRYLNTLCSEADRLSHLVENVLSYARLERGAGRRCSQSLPLSQLVERVSERLARRAEQAGMKLVVEAGEGADRLLVLAEVSAVEQILLNLVDNACKYAAAADDKRIHLEGSRDGRGGLIRVRDHGPGLSAEGRRRLFRPFSKSAREAAHSKPGVGLGLALSRRLARDMGGDLRLDASAPDGACFVLSLPGA